MSLTRRLFNQISSGAVLAQTGIGGVGLQALGASPAQDGIFPYGTHIYREPHLPLDQLRQDLPLLKRLGFTMVKIQESWSTDERIEGQIDLSNVAQVVADARQNGLAVYFGITMEQAPAWLWRKYPDARMQWETGEPVTDPTQYLLPSDGKPGPCWNHPGARASAVRFIEQVGRQIGHYDNILVWNVWQEVTLEFQVGSHIGLCYCPNTIAAFQGWLREKYPSISALNESWRTAYANWEEIDPPRRFTKVPSMIDWRYFMENVYLADALRFKAEAFRRTDPQHRRILAHTSGPRYGSSADWRLARSLDIYGSSAYPGWGEFQDPGVSDEERVVKSPAVEAQLNGLMLEWDYMRCASVNGEFWDAELQGGRAGGGINPGRVPDSRDIRRWVFAALAGGARGVCFWNHRSEPFWDEAYGFGLMELQGGADTERMKEAARISRAITARASDILGRGTVPDAATAILVDEDLWSFVSSSGPEVKEAFLANLRGVHLACWREGIPVDFLDTRDLAVRSSKYKVLIFPLPLALGNSVIAGLRSYVQQGGTLISGACPGRLDNYGFGMAGEMHPQLVELFGAEHKQLISLSGRKPHPSQNTVSPTDVPPLVLTGSGPHSGARVSPAFYLQYLKPKSATPFLAFRDECVGAANHFGSGSAILVGTLVGNAILEGDGQKNQELLAALIRQAGVQPDRAGGLVRRRRVLNGSSAWFLFNTSRESVEELVPVGNAGTVEDLLNGPVQVRDNRVAVKVGPMDVACLILKS